MHLLKIFLVVFFNIPLLLFAQTVNISGKVLEENSKEPLIGAHIYVKELLKSTYSDNTGFYTLNIDKNKLTEIVFSYVGYQTDTIYLSSSSDTTLNYIFKKGTTLKTIEITDANEVRQQNFGRVKLTQENLKQRSYFFGETDVVKVFQLMPGVSNGNEGSSSLFVRGGSPDQNLVLLDDIPLYNPTHLGGFLSVFDINAIKEVNLFKGNFPARYSGRLSSVIDVRLKEGHANNWKKEFSVGILSSNFFIEGPLKKEKTTLMFSARRSFADLLYNGIGLIQNLDETVGFSINDVNLKLRHQLANNKSFTFHFYRGRDRFSYKSRTESNNLIENYTNQLKWGNTVGGISYRQFGKKYTLKNLLSITSYNYNTTFNTQIVNQTDNDKVNQAYGFSSGIIDVSFKNTFDYYFNSKFRTENGINLIAHQFLPQLKSSENDVPEDLNATSFLSTELGAYTQWSYSLNQVLTINAGVHLVYFLSPSENFASFYPQPRLKLDISLSESILLFGSYSKMVQFSHLLTSSNAGFPSDLWVPATKIAKPSISDQLSAGFNYSWNKYFEIGVELYHKKLQHLIEYTEGVSFFRGSTNWQDKIEINGNGSSSGIEFIVQRKLKRLNGHFAYTLAKSDRQFQAINNGIVFPFKFDRRHDVALSLNYQLTSSINFNLAWVYQTGVALTLPTVAYNIPLFEANANSGNTFLAELYKSRNSYRSPDYHRLDIDFIFTKAKKKGERRWAVGLYNVYNKLNPYFIYLNVNDVNEIELNGFVLFPILPSLSYSRSF